VGSVASSAWRPTIDRPVPIVQLVVAAGRPFRVTVEMIDCAAAIGGVMPVVTIQEVTSRQTLSQWIRNRFGLTSREARVALHLTRRRSNAEIARALRISPHTARRHTEKVMNKLNVHSRFAVRKQILAAIDSLERRRGAGRHAAKVPAH
jgi:DNA-binding CsgD family transcriptional regulator